MDDAAVVSSLHRGGDLPTDSEGFLDWQRTQMGTVRERLPGDELHHQKWNIVDQLESVHRCDIGVIERGEQPCFAVESGEAVGM